MLPTPNPSTGEAAVPFPDEDVANDHERCRTPNAARRNAEFLALKRVLTISSVQRSRPQCRCGR